MDTKLIMKIVVENLQRKKVTSEILRKAATESYNDILNMGTWSACDADRLNTFAMTLEYLSEKMLKHYGMRDSIIMSSSLDYVNAVGIFDDDYNSLVCYIKESDPYDIIRALEAEEQSAKITVTVSKEDADLIEAIISREADEQLRFANDALLPAIKYAHRGAYEKLCGLANLFVKEES